MNKFILHALMACAAGLCLAASPTAQAPPAGGGHGWMRVDATELQRRAFQRQHALQAPSAPELLARIPGARSGVLPATFSLLDKVPYVPEDRNQGACGNCWVWASTALAEVALNTSHHISDRLSIQYLDSARTEKFSCLGGTLTDFTEWYAGHGTSSNARPGVLIPWSNPGAQFLDGHVGTGATRAIVSLDRVGQVPAYTGVTMTPATVATTGVTQAEAIANIQAALLNHQAVGFSFWTDFGSSSGFEAFWNTQAESALWHNPSEGQPYDPSLWGGHMVTIVGYDASDTANPANNHWIVLNSWGTTAARPTGLFRMPMAMNYDATFTYGTPYSCYEFEVLELPTVDDPGAVAPAATLSAPNLPALAAQAVTFSAEVSAGSPPLSYQWQMNGTDIPGAILSTYTLPSLTPALDGQTFGVKVANGQGSLALGPTILKVAGTQLLPNPGFEDGKATTDWFWNSASAPFFQSAFWSRTGSWYGIVQSTRSITSRTFTVPSGEGSVYASYWLQYYPVSTSPASVDGMAVCLVDAYGAVARVLQRHGIAELDHPFWASETFDISEFKGRVLSLQVLGKDPNTSNLYLLDDFAVVQAAGPVSLPRIDAFTPANGAAGDAVTLKGSGFSGLRKVGFGGAAATFQVQDDATVVATVPNLARTGPLRVEGPAGAFTSRAPFAMAATLTSFSPRSGVVGDSIALRGSCLTGTTAVQFNGIPATFELYSDTLIVAVVPSGITSGPISITGPSGTATSKDAFFVDHVPVITSFTPDSGPAGTVVTLAGTGLAGTQSLYFGDYASATFTVVDDTQIQATVPRSGRTGLITLYNRVGTCQTATPFTVPAPTLTSFSPTEGAVGTLVTLKGTGLSGASSISFGNGYGTYTFTVVDDTQLTVKVPTNATSGPISIIAPSGTAISAGSFTVPAPTLASFSPTEGGVGTLVTLKGTGLSAVNRISFGSGYGTYSFTVVDDTKVTVRVPVDATSGPIAVFAPAGIATSLAVFTVPGPTLSAFSPASGAPGTEVILTGTGLLGTKGVTFNSASSYSYTADSDTQVRAVIPGNATTGPISVTTASGTAVSSVAFKVVAPTFTSFSPASGRLGSTVTITGTGLRAISSLDFNGRSAYSFSLVSDTQITVEVPVGATTGPLSLAWAQGKLRSDTPFTVIFPAPVITSLSPDHGPIDTYVSVQGTGFLGATEIAFNGAKASVAYSGSDTSIQVWVPQGATTGPVTLTTPGGTGTSPTPFTIPAPVLTSFSPASGGLGTRVTLVGSGLAGYTRVEFNGTKATYGYASGDNAIYVEVPIGATSGPIMVVSPSGTATTATPFTVVRAPLALASFTPDGGGDGTLVTLIGTGFKAVTGVSFNGTAASYFDIYSDTQIMAYAPYGVTSGPITLASPYGSVQSSTPFRVLPVLQSFSPGSGPAGTVVTLTGSHLTGATSVTFGGAPAAAFQVVDDSRILATVPGGASIGPISVTSLGGTTSSSASFMVTLAISGMAPSSGAVGTQVVLAGVGLGTIREVRFAPQVTAAIVSQTATQLRITVPAGAATGPITLVNGDGAILASPVFTVLAPGITGFSPASGPAGTLVTVSGSGLAGATAVTFHGVQAVFHVVDDTSLTATVPAGALTGALQVTAPGGVFLGPGSFTVSIGISLQGTVPGNLLAGRSLSLAAAVTGASDTRVRWSASAGTLDDPAANPVTFTAPVLPGTVTLTATSVADPAVHLSLSIRVGTADLQNDGAIDVLDMAVLAGSYGLGQGQAGFAGDADLNGDGKVDDKDILLFLNAF